MYTLVAKTSPVAHCIAYNIDNMPTENTVAIFKSQKLERACLALGVFLCSSVPNQTAVPIKVR